MSLENNITRPEYSVVHSIRRKRRSTYCESNALLFKQFFDIVIESGKEMTLPWSYLPNVKPASYYVKISDGLKFLADNEPEMSKRGQYLLLKSQFKFSVEVDGIALRHKNPNRIDVTSIVKEALPLSTAKNQMLEPSTMYEGSAPEVTDDDKKEFQAITKTWKEEITDFINSGKKGVIKEFAFKTITDDDVEWIANVCSNTGVEWVKKGNIIKMIKE